MIVDKHKPLPEIDMKAGKPVDITPPDTTVSAEPYATNALIEVAKALKHILRDLREDPDNPDSPPLFKTIKVNNGQLSRIKNDKWNKEGALGLPAVLLHFINVRYLVQQARIGEGRATVRVQYILNRLNNGDDDCEMEGFALFQRINAAIQERKKEFTALTTRFQLVYFDQPESFDDGLQPFWIDYEVWFSEYSAYRYKKYVDTYLVVPPFTNHTDQLPENNTNDHADHTEPMYDNVSGFQKPND